MKSTWISLAICFILSINSYAQAHETNFEISNSTRTSFSSPYGYPIFNSSQYGYYIEGVDTIYRLNEMISVWIGTEHDGEILVAGAFFNDSDFYPGPINSTSNQTYFDNYWEVDKVAWSFTEEDITNLKSLYAFGNLTLDDLSPDILSYPAKNNEWYVNKYGFIIKEDLAPFYDHDNDGRYDPLKGDHPIPLSENPDFIPHAFNYTVYNDIADVHPFSMTNPIGVEIQQINYLVNSDNRILDATLYSRLVVTNKSPFTYENVRLGLVNELDHRVGNSPGFSESQNAVYFYNLQAWSPGADTLDIYITKFHNQQVSNNISFINRGIGNPPTGTHEPRSGAQIFNYLNGRWSDGSPLTYGGTGFNPGSTDTVRYQFPDIPSDSSGWSVRSMDLPFYDYMNLPSFEIGEFNPNDSYMIDFSTTIIHDPSTSQDEKIEDLGFFTARTQNFYNESINPILSSTQYETAPDGNISFYPNPTTGLFAIESDLEVRHIRCFDAQGAVCKALYVQDDHTVDIRSCASNMVLVQIELKDGSIVYKKVIKSEN